MTSLWYKAEWSTGMITSTAVVMVVLLSGILLTSKMCWAHNTVIRVLGISLEASMVGMALFSYLLSPRGYTIDNANLTIVRWLKPVVIPLAGISKTEPSTDKLLDDSIRLLGNHGLWGCYGKYRNNKLGTYYLYARNLKNLILLEGEKKYVVAPERPQEFLQDLNRAVAEARGVGKENQK